METAMSRCTPDSVASGPSLGAYDDAMSALYVTLSETRQSDVTVGETQVEENQLQQQREEAQERAAIQQEQANAATSGGGFLSEVGHFFSDVASDLAHGRIASAFDDGGRDLEEAWKSPKFWNDLRTGLEDVAVVAGAAAAAVMTAGIGTVAIAGAAAATAAVAGGAAGLAGLRVAHFAAAAADASADATSGRDHIEQLGQRTADVLADVKQADQSHRRALESLTQSIQTSDQTLVVASTMPVKG
jgi:hypothetical protein